MKDDRAWWFTLGPPFLRSIDRLELSLRRANLNEHPHGLGVLVGRWRSWSILIGNGRQMPRGSCKLVTVSSTRSVYFLPGYPRVGGPCQSGLHAFEGKLTTARH